MNKSLRNTEILRRRNRELSILNAIAEAFNRSVDLHETLQAALAQVADLLDLETGWIWLLQEETGESYLAASQNLPPALANNPRRMEGSCYCLDTYRAGDLDGAANVNVVTCSRLRNLVDGTDGLRYHASIPLYAHGKHLGVLNVASTDWRELTQDDLRLLYTIGDMLSIAIERAHLYRHSMEYGAAEERNRLAREIHDTLAQGLAGISMQLETAEALLESGYNPENVRSAVHKALDLTRTNLEEARRSVLDLRAAPLEGRNLANALETLTQKISSENDLKAHFLVVGRGQPLPVRLEAGLYRIAQEALSNVVQHAAAKNVTMKLTSTPDEIRLLIKDDGRGFDPSQIPAGRFGLQGLHERAKLLGGKLKVESDLETGTEVEIFVPLQATQRRFQDD
jgi:two-component system NarL family sensor kinase